MFGSIGKLMSGIAGSVAGKGDIGGIIEQAAKTLTSNMGAISGQLKTLGSFGNMQGTIDKAVYIAILNGAIQKAAKSQHFNIETHINDLWTSFSVVRSKRPTLDGLEAQLAKQSDMMQMLSQMLKKHDDMAKQAISNMR